MGGATSKLKVNEWEKADGGLTSAEETIDGAPPTSKYEVFHITKRGVNQRDFDITDSESNLIYTTRQVPGTIACFDLLGKEMDNYLIRVNVDLARRYWTLYRFEEAAFDGQSPDKHATEKLVAQRLQEAENNPQIENFNTPFLFRKAVIIVSWSRYMAVATFYGPPSEEMVKQWQDERLAELQAREEEEAERRALLLEKEKSNQENGDDGDHEGEINNPQEGQQEIVVAAVDSSDDKVTLKNKLSDMTIEEEASAEVRAEASAEAILPRRPPSSELGLKDSKDSMEIGSSELSEVDLVSEELSLPNPSAETPAETTTAAASAEESKDANKNNNNDDADENNGNNNDDEGQHWLVPVRTAESAPELGTSDSSAPEVASAEAGTALALPSRSSRWFASSTRERTSSETRRTKFRDWAKQKSQNISERYKTALENSGIISSKKEKRDPLEGVIHLNKPLLLCQEIYTRIIGNHQTSRISKKEAIRLMKQDIAQHEKDDPEGAKKDEEEDPIMTGQEVILRTRSEDSSDSFPGPRRNKRETSGEAEVSIMGEEMIFRTQSDEFSAGGGEPEHKSVESEDEEEEEVDAERNETAAPAAVVDATVEPTGDAAAGDDAVVIADGADAKEGKKDDKEEADAKGSDESVDAEDAKSKDGEEGEDGEQPLVGYWLWENTLRTHKMKMHVAKGTDLALHVVLSIIVNQVRYERNALAMTV